MQEELVTYPTAALAKRKGFDEECRFAFVKIGDVIKPLDPPKDTEMMSHVRGLIVKYMKDLPKLLEMISSDAQPLYNSRLPQEVCSRPTQDLLARWLREKHAIHARVYVHNNERYHANVSAPARISPECIADEYAYLQASGCAIFEDAFEIAIQHSLKLLPDVESK